MIVSWPLGCLAVAVWFARVWQRSGKLSQEAQAISEVVWTPAFALFLSASIPWFAFLRFTQAPPDDLLRNLVGWAYHFDYARAYWGSPGVTHIDEYFGFDQLASWCYRHLGRQRAYIPFQAVALMGFSIVLPAAYLREARRGRWGAWAIPMTLAATAMTWMTLGFSQRIVSSRPEVFFTIWSLSAVLVESSWATIAWAAVGLVLSPMYWLGFVYFPMAFLMRRSAKQRWAVFGVLMAAFFGFWLVHTHGGMVRDIVYLRGQVHNRVFGVGESRSILVMATSMPGAGLLLFAALSLQLLIRQATPWKLDGWRAWWSAVFAEQSPWMPGLLLLWFCLPDMIRYVDVVAPLLALLAIRWMSLAVFSHEGAGPRWPSWLGMGMLVSLAIALCALFGTFHPQKLNRIEIPGYTSHTRVLTYFGSDTYQVLYANPGIQVAPAMELGMTTREVQHMSTELAKGTLSCQALHRHRVDWVVTEQADWKLGGAAQRCLSLYQIFPDGTSVWKVSP